MHLCPYFWNECLHESLFWANFAFVIEFARHIEILLLDNDCVIIPGLGGFVAHHISARYDEDDGLFLPPYRTLGFNPQLTLNDSLLAQSYADAYDISFLKRSTALSSKLKNLRISSTSEALTSWRGWDGLPRTFTAALLSSPMRVVYSRRAIMDWARSTWPSCNLRLHHSLKVRAKSNKKSPRTRVAYI